jgi:hypothetical protein
MNRSYDDILKDLNTAYAKAEAAAKAIAARQGDRAALLKAFGAAIAEAHELEAELQAVPWSAI